MKNFLFPRTKTLILLCLAALSVLWVVSRSVSTVRGRPALALGVPDGPMVLRHDRSALPSRTLRCGKSIVQQGSKEFIALTSLSEDEGDVVVEHHLRVRQTVGVGNLRWRSSAGDHSVL